MNANYVNSTAFWLCVVMLGFTSPLQAQDEPELGWGFKAQLSSVWVGGNSESSSIGFRSTAKRDWRSASWTTAAGFLRTESTLKSRQAVGTVDSFEIEEETNRETTAESFFARSKVDKNLNPKLHLVGGVDWLRNTFSGIDSRFLLAAGAGVTLSDTKELAAKTDLSFTYTFEQDVVTNPFASANFPGLRAGYDVTYLASESTTLESELIADWNLDNSDDFRVDWTNAMSVAINSRLALKPSTLIQWKNDPALKQITLVDSEGVATGQTVLIPLEKTDWFFNLAIVLTL
ncbi:MAG TPA: DUF481 domain-containing protein [Rhodothermales bacterium]|nr:DUF481 domain-containing protein [Rhodothermales bacterium]